MKEEVIECPMKVMDIFPYGKVLVPDMKKLKKKIKYLEMRKSLGLKIGSQKTSNKNNSPQANDDVKVHRSTIHSDGSPEEKIIMTGCPGEMEDVYDS